MLNLAFPEVRRFARAARQHHDVAVRLIAPQVRGVKESEEAYHAVYIGGYGVECALKAVYLSQLPERRHAVLIEGQVQGSRAQLGRLLRQSTGAVRNRDAAGHEKGIPNFGTSRMEG